MTSGAASRSGSPSGPAALGAERPMSFGDELDRERAQIMRAVRRASDGWAEAMRAHKLAPPDAGFAQRLRNLAEAAATEQVAWEHAHARRPDVAAGARAENAAPPVRAAPGTGRRGPRASCGSALTRGRQRSTTPSPAPARRRSPTRSARSRRGGRSARRRRGRRGRGGGGVAAARSRRGLTGTPEPRATRDGARTVSDDVRPKVALFPRLVYRRPN